MINRRSSLEMKMIKEKLKKYIRSKKVSKQDGFRALRLYKTARKRGINTTLEQLMQEHHMFISPKSAVTNTKLSSSVLSLDDMLPKKSSFDFSELKKFTVVQQQLCSEMRDLLKQKKKMSYQKNNSDSYRERATIHRKRSSKNPTVVGTLCVFFGFLGLHRLYVGKVLTGVLQTLTLGGLGVWAFVDMIRIFCGDFKDDKGDRVDKGNSFILALIMLLLVGSSMMLALHHEELLSYALQLKMSLF